MVESLAYCQKKKGLELFCWCVMSNHVHLIAKAKEGFKLSAIIRDMKKHTSKQITEVIKEGPESRKEWLLDTMLKAGKQNSKAQTYQLWRNDNQPLVLYKPETTRQKLNYIHNNPVENGIVENPEDYLYSSARNYMGREGLLEVMLL